MDVKKRLAYELVTQFHDVRDAQVAENRWAKQFQKREVPEEEVIKLKTPVGLRATLTVELTKAGLTKSRSEARRLLAQGAIEINGEAVTEDLEMAQIKKGSVIKVGKRRFAST
jgi:tyrosyl-tRNA synthetase